MTWFRRGGHSPAGSSSSVSDSPAGAPAPPGPVELIAEIFSMNRFVNQHSGHLPGAAVVTARAITDLLRQIVDTTGDGPLDVQAALFVEGTVRDYLPTTLRTFLAVDPAMANAPRPTGGTPTTSLLDQLRLLRSSAAATLTAAREQDADALLTQGNFLSTKFSRSDLDL